MSLGMDLDLLEEDQGPGLTLLLEQLSAAPTATEQSVYDGSPPSPGTPPAAQIAQFYRHSGLRLQENRRDVYAGFVYITCRSWLAGMESADTRCVSEIRKTTVPQGIMDIIAASFNSKNLPDSSPLHS